VPPGATEPITVKFANQPTISKVQAAASVQPVATAAPAAAASVNTSFKYVDSIDYYWSSTVFTSPPR